MSDDPKPTPGALVKGLRLRLGLSQEASAERGGILRTELSAIENERRKASSFDMRRSLARAFGLSIEDLADYLDGRIDLDAVAHRSDLPQGGAAA